LAERAYRLEQRPRPLLESRLAANHDELAALREILGGWRERGPMLTRIVVVLGAAVGRWRTAMEILLASFPDARIDCLVDAANVWETRAWSHPRVHVELIDDWDRALIR